MLTLSSRLSISTTFLINATGGTQLGCTAEDLGHNIFLDSGGDGEFKRLGIFSVAVGCISCACVEEVYVDTCQIVQPKTCVGQVGNQTCNPWRREA